MTGSSKWGETWGKGGKRHSVARKKQYIRIIEKRDRKTEEPEDE